VALFSTGYRSQGRSCEHGPYFIRVRNAAGKYQWVKHETEAAAKEAAKLAPLAQKAQELGLTVDEATNTANASRTSIKTAIENYLHERRFGRPRSIKVYENVFDQLLTNLRCGIKFVDQLATARRDIVSTDNRSDICPGAATARSSTRIGPGDDASAASTNTASAATAFTSARSPTTTAASILSCSARPNGLADHAFPDPLLAQIFVPRPIRTKFLMRPAGLISTITLRAKLWPTPFRRISFRGTRVSKRCYLSRLFCK
jgi:hypothetical protein